MAFGLGPPETHCEPASRVELSARRDGSRDMRISGARGTVAGVLAGDPRSARAVLFVAPADYGATFLALGHKLAARAIASFALDTRGLSDEQLVGHLGVARRALAQRGVERIAVVGGGAGCAAALDAAKDLAAEAVALFSPPQPPEARLAERLSGRPLHVFCGGDAAAWRAWEVFRCEPAGAALGEVLADVAAAFVPRILDAFEAQAPARS